MVALPYVSAVSWLISESHQENLFEMKTGSYAIETTFGINPIDEEYQITWNLPVSSKTNLLNTYRSNPLALYDWTPPGGNQVSVRIKNLTVDPIKIDGSYHKVTGTLVRRYL